MAQTGSTRWVANDGCAEHSALRPLSLPALCVALLKLRIGLAIALSGLAGMAVAAGQLPGLTDLAVFGLAVLVAAGGAGAFNHWFDRDIDAVMGRTRTRPFASGQLSSSVVWPLVFFLLMLVGSLIVVARFGLASGAMVLAGALTYAVIYTVWLKRRTHWNIVIGGAAGSWAVLAGAAAAGGLDSTAVWALAVVLFLWTPSHFWSLAVALADDYRRAGVPMLPVTSGRGRAVRWNLVNTLVLVAAGLVLAWLVGAWPLWLATIAGGGWLLWKTLRMVANPERGPALSAFKASLIQLGVLLLGLFFAYVLP